MWDGPRIPRTRVFLTLMVVSVGSVSGTWGPPDGVLPFAPPDLPQVVGLAGTSTAEVMPRIDLSIFLEGLAPGHDPAVREQSVDVSGSAAVASEPDPVPNENVSLSSRSQSPVLPTANAASPLPPPSPSAPPAPVVPPSPSTTSPAPVGQWRPWRTNPDHAPVRWGPCEPLRFVTRLSPGPSFARSELHWAIAQIESATGLDLVWVGDVAEPFSSSWPRSGPIHVGFATEEEFSMPSWASGYGEPTVEDVGGGFLRYVGGRVVIRPDHAWTQGVSSQNPLGLMFLHELGHVAGLAHVDTADEIMGTGGNGSARALGPGDRAGFAAVGRQTAC